MAFLRSSSSVYVGGTHTRTGQSIRTITDVRVDPRFEPLSTSYDFAVLRLDRLVEIDTQLVLNSEASFPTDKTPLTVIGYGRTNQADGISSPTLQETSILYRADCSDVYDGRVKPYEMMCANDPDYSKDACQGM